MVQKPPHVLIATEAILAIYDGRIKRAKRSSAVNVGVCIDVFLKMLCRCINRLAIASVFL